MMPLRGSGSGPVSAPPKPKDLLHPPGRVIGLVLGQLNKGIVLGVGIYLGAWIAEGVVERKQGIKGWPYFS